MTSRLDGSKHRWTTQGRALARSLFMLALAAGPALASDGVLEINQTCARQAGCFVGDAAGYPVTIDGAAGHSYRLTSDLVVPDGNTDGIVVSTDNISIDLAGFEIRGPVVCSGTLLVCVPNAGTGSGVERTSDSLSGISVRNGSIRGMGSYGLLLGNQSVVTNVRVRSNRRVGISTNAGSAVSGNTAHMNGSGGIDVGDGSIVSGNVAFENGNDGIFADDGSTVAGNTVYRNDGDGIESGLAANVVGNNVHRNVGFGLNLFLSSGYRENVLHNNDAGTVDGSALINLGDNACDGAVVCP